MQSRQPSWWHLGCEWTQTGEHGHYTNGQASTAWNSTAQRAQRTSRISMVMERDTTSREARSLAVGA